MEIKHFIGFPEDQIRCFLLLLLSYPLSSIFYYFISYKRASAAVRHLYNISIGLGFSLFCFGLKDTIVLVSAVGFAYLILLTCRPEVVHWCMLVYALIFVAVAHTYCMIQDYGGWNTNFTGPLMIMVQKLTYVSCELHDGCGRSDEDLTADQRNLKINQVPSVLEFTSYNFNFITFLAGPSCPYKEYIDFITGDNIVLQSKGRVHQIHKPSPLYPAIAKCVNAFTCLTVYVILGRYFSMKLIQDPNSSLLLRIVYITFFMIKHRCFYYFIFYIGESICNVSGLGFRGYNEEGTAQWDLIKNAELQNVEFPLNIRTLMTSWNITTSKWLRRCIYERIPIYPVAITFMVSALWHGLYPGYFITFAITSVGTSAARKVRYLFHSHCQKPRYIKFIYDLSGIISTCIVRDYAGLPFVLLTLQDSLIALSYYYYIPLLACIMLTLLPLRASKLNKNY